MRLAFIYDRVNKIGGAERVLTALHQIWPEAPLYTSVYDPANATWAKDFQVIPSFLNRFAIVRNHHEWFANLMPYAFESFDLSAYDVVISVTSAEAKGVLTKPGQLHLCYLLTPTRYLWSQRLQHQGMGLIAKLRQPFMDSLSAWDIVAATRPDTYISISNEVDRRCRQYYHRDSQVIYPPVDTTAFADHPKPCLHPEPGYFLVVSRLVPYKRVDLAIKACRQTGDRLVVVGSGSEETKLRHLADQNVTFMGQVSDDQLACLYHHAKALIFPQEEEFGIVALEAQAAGLPVIAYSGGAGPEVVVDGQTGQLFHHQTVNDLAAAIASFKAHTWYDKTIRAHAAQFDKLIFMRQFKQMVEELWQQHLSKS